MTTTPPDTSSQPGPPDSGPRVGWDEIRDLARIRRSRSNRRIAGVAGGLARHLDIDPVILRVAFVVLSFFGGVGLLLYVALWLLLPEDGRDWAKIKLDRRSRTVALLIVGVLALALLFSSGWWGHGGGFFFLAIVVGAIALATQLPRRDRGRPGPAPGEPHPYATGDTAVTGDAVTGDPATGDPALTPPPPTTYAVPEQPRPVNPRKRGPILFWFALAVSCVALGTLGVFDLAGADVAPAAYPATVLAVCAAFLLLGSFFGRAGGLILIGLLAAFLTVGTTIADHWNPHRSTIRPVSASAVHDAYSIDVGDLVLDLTQVHDLGALDGRTIHVDGNVGHLDIRVPAGMTVVSNAEVTGVGAIHAFGSDDGGPSTSVTSTHEAGARAPRLTIDSQLHVGAIDVSVGWNH
jgi:phage shock protein PspC (stress-responsive transcriptional regulator)